MTDVPGNATTGVTIAVGTAIEGQIETVGDHDWYRVSLTAGQKITIAVNVVTLEDPYVYIRNAGGTVLGENDDGGGGRGSRLVFTAPTTGTYYIDVAAWTPTEPMPDYTGTGAYELSVSNYVLPPVGTLDEFAYQMTHGFFDGDSHHFDVTQGGTITVDLTGITNAGRTIARQALQQWSDIIGVNFVEQSGDAQITFDDLDQGTGAFADVEYSNGISTSAIVNVSLQRLNLHTYMHEIGHALGIGHTSNSNAGTAAAIYPDDAIWSNDGAAISIMSYFDNGENGYYADRGFSNVPIMTPQVADIIAMGNLYGLSTTTRTGNTTYGFNNNSGRDAFDAVLHPNVSYTIFDSGGIDTLDYSGFASNQRIDLNPEAFSNIGSLTGNVVIARGTVIENAIGGSGRDTLIGNSAANVLNGGTGIDTLKGLAGNDTYFVDNAGDVVIEYSSSGSDIVYSSIDYSLGNNVENLRLIGSANIDATGNSRNNLLVGNSGSNVLDGGAGADRMGGGAGDDAYYVGNVHDEVVEQASAGSDTVFSTISYTLGSNVETLRLIGSAAVNGTGNALDNIVAGNSGANTLSGGGGNDKLYGGKGADQLWGGSGADEFAFGTGHFGGLTAGTAERIHDFSHADGDRIGLDQLDANSLIGGNQAFTFIGSQSFHGAAGELRSVQSAGFTYVYGDTNGDGTEDFLIVLDGTHSLTSGDFVL